MQTPFPESNPAPTPAPRARKARAQRCARCGRALTKPGTVIPALGVVGPECETQVTRRLAHLQRQGLGALALTGETRLAALRLPDGSFVVPHDALSALNAIARRVGVELGVRFEPAASAFVVTLTVPSLQAFVRRAGGGAA